MIRIDSLFSSQITQKLYSMKRKTVNQISFPQHVRSLKKNKSCQLNQTSFNRALKERRRKNEKAFTSATAIVDLLVGEWLENLDEELRASDQRQFQLNILQVINDATNALSNMLDPAPTEKLTNSHTVSDEQEPHPIAGDLFCGGNTITCEGKTNKMPRISIALSLEAQHKREASQFNTSKSNISTKCLIKLPKEQFQQRRQGLQALKDEQTSQRDVFQEILRDKLAKDKKNLYFNQEKLQVKQSGLPSIEQYSFDYDGSIFPLKKTSIQTSHRIKILNTTCKIVNRQFIDHRKQSLIAKMHGAHLKTEMDQTQKQNKRYLDGLKRDLSQRRQSNTDSTRELLRICTEADELTYKSKIQQSIGGKSVKLREIKAH